MVKNTRLTRRIAKIGPDHYERIKKNTHILYRCFNRKNLLLYVGITNHPENRLKQHQSDKPWWKHVDHITLESFTNREELHRAEAVAIQSEKPRFNVVIPTGGREIPLGRRSKNPWPDASTFGVVTAEHSQLMDMTLEQQLYPCLECHARAIYCQGEIVSCKLCCSEWSFDHWFQATFVGKDTPINGQMTLM